MKVPSLFVEGWSLAKFLQRESHCYL